MPLRQSPGVGFDDIKKVTCMDEHIGFFFDNYHIVDRKLSFTCFSRRFAHGIEAIERGKAQVGVGNMDEVHRIILNGILWDIRGVERG